MANIKLDKTCFCGRNYWCEKPGCAGDPHKKPPAKTTTEEKAPWEEERIVEKVKEPPRIKKAMQPIVKNVTKEKYKQKAPNSIRFPQEVLDHFGHPEAGWQRRINDALLEIARKNRT